MKEIYRFLSFLAAFALLTACSDSVDFNEDNRNTSGAAEVVTIEVDINDIDMESRGSYIPDIPYISRGNKIDQLIFCLYEKKDDGSYVEIPGDGQHTVDMTKKKWPYPITLSLEQNKTYSIAIWAQKGDDESLDYKSPYETTDLKNVKVNYTYEKAGKLQYYPNNDEFLDAFCGSLIDFTVGQRTQKVILHRPFAQINIGTSGADYANLIYDPLLNPSEVTITESRIKVTKVANRFNVLTGIADAWDFELKKVPENDLTADFEWSPLPAWINSGVPAYRQPGDKFDETNPYPFVKLPATSKAKEEFLIVDIDRNDGGIQDYKTDYPTLVFGQEVNGVKSKQYLTETFKYLSMCYVLVPTMKDQNGNNTGTTVNVEYDFRQNIQELNENSKDKVIRLSERTLLYVPVQANWRTNILGGLNNTGDPDPTSIFNAYQFPIILSEKFDGDKNVRYYSATINIHRDQPELDGLTITPENGQTIPVEDDDKPLDNIIQSVYFAGENSVYTFTVNEGYEVIIKSSVVPYWDEEHINWKTATPEGNVPENKKSTSLILYPGATSAQFNITISKEIPKEDKPEDDKTD